MNQQERPKEGQQKPARRYHASRPRPRRGSFGIDPLGVEDCSWGNPSLIEIDHGTALWTAEWATEKRQNIEAPGSSIQTISSTHEPLQDGRTIRLLKLLKHPPNTSEVRCMLEHHSLDTMPPFEALSYAWGSPMYDEDGRATDTTREMNFLEVTCDGKPYVVTENLFYALRQLARSGEHDYLWVDALCIDQTNLEEKASQILIMGDIYACANQVIVWLGNDSSDVSVFSHIRDTLVHTLKRFEADNGPNSL